MFGFSIARVFLLGLSALVFCANPEWTLKAPKDDGAYLYYVGRSSEAASESDAYKSATQNAYEQAIRENFGLTTRLENENVELEQGYQSKVTTSKRLQEKSSDIEIHDFEQVDAYKEDLRSGKVNLWLLFRYKKSAIETEKTRLSKQTEKNKKVNFSEQGSDPDQGILELTSEPQGAAVIIDGERYGKTPLKLLGQLSVGRHLVQFQHPDYDAEETEIVMASGIT